MDKRKMITDECWEKMQRDLHPVLEPTKNPFILANRWLLEHSVLWCFWTMYAETFVYPFKWFILAFFTLEFLYYGIN